MVWRLTGIYSLNERLVLGHNENAAEKTFFYFVVALNLLEPKILKPVIFRIKKQVHVLMAFEINREVADGKIYIADKLGKSELSL